MIVEAEVDVRAGSGPEVGPSVAGALDALNAFETLTAALAEQRVLERILGVEVGVQGLGPHPDLLPDIPEREAGDAVLPHELPGRFQDLDPCGLTPFGSPVARRSN